jgi:hypothetical protein
VEKEGLTYRLLARNPNTAVGCVLDRSGAIIEAQRSSILLAFRASRLRRPPAARRRASTLVETARIEL